MGLVMAGCLAAALVAGFYGSVPFIVLFGSGYLGLGLRGLGDLGRVPAAPPTGKGVEGEQAEHRHPEHQAGPYGLRPDSLGRDTYRGPSIQEIRARLAGSSPGSGAVRRRGEPRARTRGGLCGRRAVLFPGSRRAPARRRTSSHVVQAMTPMTIKPRRHARRLEDRERCAPARQRRPPGTASARQRWRDLPQSIGPAER